MYIFTCGVEICTSWLWPKNYICIRQPALAFAFVFPAMPDSLLLRVKLPLRNSRFAPGVNLTRKSNNELTLLNCGLSSTVQTVFCLQAEFIQPRVLRMNTTHYVQRRIEERTSESERYSSFSRVVTESADDVIVLQKWKYSSFARYRQW